MRGVMLVMGTTLPLGAGMVEVVVARPSLISMLRKVFMSASFSPAGLPEVLSSFDSTEACTSFSAGNLVPPVMSWDWPIEDRGLLATPPG